MKLIVFGATGGTGREAAAQAVERGDEVTVFVRSPERLGPARDRLRVIRGEAFDAESVASAIAGHDAVISSLGTRPWRHTDICSEGTRHILAGMMRHRVRRIVVVSSLGVAESREWTGFLARKLFFELAIRRAIEDKGTMERLVRESDREWIIVRPVLLTNGKLRGSVRASIDGSIRGGFVSRADVARFCLAQLGSDAYLRRAPVVAA